MSNARERVLETLKLHPDGLCDDCLSEVSGVRPRQQVHQRVTELHQAGQLERGRRSCPRRHRIKLVSAPKSTDLPAASKAVRRQSPELGGTQNKEGPWYWEGNVQGRVADYLVSRGYQIESTADTATREQGKDIVAKGPDGRVLWVTVKGWPERSQSPQARHWFAGLLFDIILYHEEDPNADLAIGLPAGFTTYENLWRRVGWLRKAVPFRAFWVSSDGSVQDETRAGGD